MPNKTIPGWTQVPVGGSEISSVLYERLPASQMAVQIVYEVKDTLGVVRDTKVTRSTLALAAYPLSAAATTALCNTAEGT